MLKKLKYMSLLTSTVLLSGCCLFSDYMSEPDGEFAGTVPSHKPARSFNAEKAVNRMETRLLMDGLRLFGGRTPIVDREFSSFDDVYNTLPDRVYHSLIRDGSIKAYYKGVTADAEMTLKSSIKSNEGGCIWILKLVTAENRVVWEQKLQLKM